MKQSFRNALEAIFVSSDMKRNFALLSGPLAFLLLRLAAQSFGSAAASALGMAAWMALWWVFRPVGIAVTALLPIAVNAVLNLIPSGHVISNYFSEIVVLLLGADLICLTWSRTGLDRRVAVKALCGIGTSMRQQIVAWLGASVVLSVFLPNVVVAAILCPIAAAMLKFVNGGEEPDVRQSAPILLAIGWGSGIGGFGSPIGGAANLVAIAYLEQLTGHEFMYVDWVLRFVPILFLVFLLNLFFLWQVNRTTQDLNGSASYFKKLNEAFGPLKRGEKIGLTLFVLATLLAFLRPLYAELLPGLKPAYSFLTLGLLMFVLRDENDEVMMDWKYAESHVMWGMMFLFASGMALGRMLIETGAVKQLTALIASSGPSGGLGTVALFAAFGCFLTELSSNTAAASIALPVVISITQAIGLNPVPYMLLTVVAVNCAYVLPVSTRAIPVSYGLDAGLQIRKGLRLTVLNVLLVTALGWFCINYVPFFSRF